MFKYKPRLSLFNAFQFYWHKYKHILFISLLCFVCLVIGYHFSMIMFFKITPLQPTTSLVCAEWIYVEGKK